MTDYIILGTLFILFCIVLIVQYFIVRSIKRDAVKFCQQYREAVEKREQNLTREITNILLSKD